MESWSPKSLLALASVIPSRVVGDRVAVGIHSISNIAESLNDVRPGTLFCCINGTRFDGHNSAAEAIERGAVALVVERELPVLVPQLVVVNVRPVIGPIASSLYGNPGSRLSMFGITGTNGKTTTANVLGHILSASGRNVEVIGTLSGAYTSPPPSVLHRYLAQLVERGVDTVVMEVSSHALHQFRVKGLHFEVGIFTNLTQDHLDYHQSMDDYFEAKSRLFTPEFIDAAVINSDSPLGAQVRDLSLGRGVGRVEMFSLSDIDEFASSVTGAQGRWRGQQIQLPVVGDFNVSNCLAAATAASLAGIEDALIVRALNTLPAIPGRLEQIAIGQNFPVFVDFAHTPDGLENVLATLKRAKGEQGRLITVFGCGGNRDAAKRPLMGNVAEKYSDLVILTSDNPRDEDPDAIVRQIRGGMRGAVETKLELNREVAIDLAISGANVGDVVLIAGKGHETTQEINGEKVPFDDRLVARNAIEKTLFKAFETRSK